MRSGYAVRMQSLGSPVMSDQEASSKPVSGNGRPFRRAAEVLLPLLAAGVLFLVIREARVLGMMPGAPSSALTVVPSTFSCEAHQGETVTAVFTLKNISSRPVRVLGAETSCGCTLPEGLPLELMPQGAGKLLVKMRVGTPG